MYGVNLHVLLLYSCLDTKELKLPKTCLVHLMSVTTLLIVANFSIKMSMSFFCDRQAGNSFISFVITTISWLNVRGFYTDVFNRTKNLHAMFFRNHKMLKFQMTDGSDGSV